MKLHFSLVIDQLVFITFDLTKAPEIMLDMELSINI